MSDCVLSCTLSLVQDKAKGTPVLWQGENVVKDFCLFTKEANRNSKVENVDFQLEATVDYPSVKLCMFERYRWTICIVEPHSGLRSFLDSLFAEGINPADTTKRALIISVIKSADHLDTHTGSNVLVYGERKDNKLYPYAHPLHDDECFIPNYQAGRRVDSQENIDQHAPILRELFGKDFQLRKSGTAKSRRLTELQLIEALNTTDDRNV